MDDTLLDCYHTETSQLLELLQEFAQKYPQVASELQVGTDRVGDGGLAHLLALSALSNARLRHKVEDDIPELSAPLVEHLVPLLSRPMPSVSVARFHVNPERLVGPSVIAQGSTIVMTDKTGELFYFQSCYPVEVLPIEITQVSFCANKMVLNITLRVFSKLSFSDFNFDRLRFFINAPKEYAYALYELFFSALAKILISSGDDVITLDSSSINEFGFSNGEVLFPYNATQPFQGQHLTEFCVLPEKFLFFEICNLKPSVKLNAKVLELQFYFNKTIDYLDKNINRDWFLLECTPVINIFKRRINSPNLQDEVVVFCAETGVIEQEAADVLCCNRTLPDSIDIALDKSQEIIKNIEFLRPFTGVKYPNENSRWGIVSHKANNPLLFVNIDFFKSVLKLYCPDHPASIFQGLLDMVLTQKILQYKNTFCYGFEIICKVDLAQFAGYNLFLSMRVLEKFIAEYFNNNQIIQLLAYDGELELYRGSVYAGLRAVL